MHDVAGVQRGERTQDVQRHRDCLVHVERTILETMVERLTLKQLHHDVDVVGGFADVVDLADTRVADARSSTRLAPETSACIAACRAQRLDGDFSTQSRIAGAVDVAHPARADERDHFVMTEPFPSTESHDPLDDYVLIVAVPEPARPSVCTAKRYFDADRGVRWNSSTRSLKTRGKTPEYLTSRIISPSSSGRHG